MRQSQKPVKKLRGTACGFLTHEVYTHIRSADAVRQDPSVRDFLLEDLNDASSRLDQEGSVGSAQKLWTFILQRVFLDTHQHTFLPRPLTCSRSNPDLIVEVAHPVITKSHGALLLSIASVLFGSPTAFADAELEAEVRAVADSTSNTLWVPAGALWGALDIQKMADRGSLKVSDLVWTIEWSLCDKSK